MSNYNMNGMFNLQNLFGINRSIYSNQYKTAAQFSQQSQTEDSPEQRNHSGECHEPEPEKYPAECHKAESEEYSAEYGENEGWFDESCE